ncbi:MAG: Asp-tRNA(Asn)/Glu-tRNA(Gln) amidotransferase subunit GatC [Planctomycetes bacterium]|jgi:aspartyl-tRNA(Asn)/glutamyl-tRNA(Gln) amidotransferase subunit C|nr:Asp-tRNA(Asn)/Glu-tRNA(Gln) amidotransferase subunit GatC [Planctomycetota bacterium]
MKISTEMVEYIAHLARIELSEDDTETFRIQLEAILDYIDKLNQLDTTGVEPMVHTLDLRNVFRADEVRPSLPPGASLANAPEHTEDSYKVPAVID